MKKLLAAVFFLPLFLPEVSHASPENSACRLNYPSDTQCISRPPTVVEYPEHEKSEKVKDTTFALLTYSQAQSFCQQKGAKLPSFVDFVKIFYSDKKINNSDVLGWGDKPYWTSDSEPGINDAQKVFNLMTGETTIFPRTGYGYVSCKIQLMAE